MNHDDDKDNNKMNKKMNEKMNEKVMNESKEEEVVHAQIARIDIIANPKESERYIPNLITPLSFSGCEGS